MGLIQVTNKHVPGFVHPTAVIGSVPEHRDYIFRWHRGEINFTYNVFKHPTIAPSAIVNAFCTIDAGLQRATSVGDGSLLMVRCHLGHDAEVGANCELGAGVVVCGEVTIGDNVQIGGNTWIRPKIRIGDGARIGGGSVVVKDVPAGEVWAGNPARPLVKGREASARGQLKASTTPCESCGREFWGPHAPNCPHLRSTSALPFQFSGSNSATVEVRSRAPLVNRDPGDETPCGDDNHFHFYGP